MKLSHFSLLAFASILFAMPAWAQDPPAYAPPAGTYTETRLSSVEEQMRVLNGRIEQIEFAVRRLEASLQRMQSDNDQRLSKLEQTQAAQAMAASAPPTVIAPQPQQPIPQQAIPLSGSGITEPEPRGTLGALKMQDGRVTGGVINPQAPPLPQAPADYGLTPQEQYERAFNLLRQANYPDAEQAFKSFIDKDPKDKLIDNAKYWYGETLYVRARFDEAAVAFADAYQQIRKVLKRPTAC